MKIQSNLCNLWIFLVSFLLIILISQEALAGNIFRVIGGAGVTKTSFDYEGMESSNHHYGVQFVSYVSDKHAYGIEIASHRVFKSKEKTYEYLSVCIILEAMPYRVLWLNQMGIAGYIGTGDNKNKPFGFRSSSGVDIPISKTISFPILLRNDIIFEDKVIFSSSLEAGISWRF